VTGGFGEENDGDGVGASAPLRTQFSLLLNFGLSKLVTITPSGCWEWAGPSRGMVWPPQLERGIVESRLKLKVSQRTVELT
jgi:hypothetical protein